MSFYVDNDNFHISKVIVNFVIVGIKYNILNIKAHTNEVKEEMNL